MMWCVPTWKKLKKKKGGGAKALNNYQLIYPILSLIFWNQWKIIFSQFYYKINEFLIKIVHCGNVKKYRELSYLHSQFRSEKLSVTVFLFMID